MAKLTGIFTLYKEWRGKPDASVIKLQHLRYKTRGNRRPYKHTRRPKPNQSIISGRNCLGAPVFRDKIGIFVPVEAKIFDA